MRRVITVLCLAGGLTLLLAGPAFAHAEEDQGDLVFAVGFAIEPAYAGQPNAVQLLVSHHDQPVTDIAPGNLQVDVGFGGQTTTIDAVPEFEVGEWGTPGDYRAPFIPTEPGPYTFHVTGTVDGEKVDFSMTSGPKTFSDVEDPSAAMFPPVQAPSTTDLAARVAAESARSAAAVSAAKDSANQSRLVAIVAVIVAIVALIVAIMGRRPSKRAVPA
jgi:hypothetical protein